MPLIAQEKTTHAMTPHRFDKQKDTLGIREKLSRQ
jgi:hypothetical protein